MITTTRAHVIIALVALAASVIIAVGFLVRKHDLHRICRAVAREHMALQNVIVQAYARPRADLTHEQRVEIEKRLLVTLGPTPDC